MYMYFSHGHLHYCNRSQAHVKEVSLVVQVPSNLHCQTAEVLYSINMKTISYCTEIHWQLQCEEGTD